MDMELGGAGSALGLGAKPRTCIGALASRTPRKRSERASRDRAGQQPTSEKSGAVVVEQLLVASRHLVRNRR